MAKSYKSRRSKLKAHGQGENRHNKGLARIQKEQRLQYQHDFNASQKNKKGKPKGTENGD